LFGGLYEEKAGSCKNIIILGWGKDYIILGGFHCYGEIPIATA
jgi:hypothetical protein